MVIQQGSQHILDVVYLGIIILYIHRLGIHMHHIIVAVIHVFPIEPCNELQTENFLKWVRLIDFENVE
jgi:hypothetical protein